MAKGRTSSPVRVKVAAQWMSHPAVIELHKQGHSVSPMTDDDATDLILHPAAHGWHEAMFEQFTRKNGEPYRPFVEAAVKAGRQRRKAK